MKPHWKRIVWVLYGNGLCCLWLLHCFQIENGVGFLRERSKWVQRIPFLLLRKWLVSDTKLLLFVYVTFVALFFVFFFWLSRFQFNNIESMCTYLFCLFWRGCISFSSKQKVFNVSNNDKELVSIFCFSSWCVWMAGMFFSLTLWFWNWSVCQQNGNTMTVSTHEHRMSRNYSR